MVPADVRPAELAAEVAEEAVAVAAEPRSNFCVPTGHPFLRCKTAHSHEGQSSGGSCTYERRQMSCMRLYPCLFACASQFHQM